MKIQEIIENMNKGKFVVWIDDKQNAPLTPDYMESHFVKLSDSLEEGQSYCDQVHDQERKAHGKATTRFRITSLKEDYVCSEDLDQETIQRLIENSRKKS